MPNIFSLKHLHNSFTYRYLATGCYFTDLHYTYRMGRSTISAIVKEVCNSIWKELVSECIPQLDEESCEAIAAGFEKNANLPHCIGAVDGKHIRVVNPATSGSLYFNYKHFFSIVLMAVADSDYKFVYVDIGAYGSECDPSVFKESTLWKSIENQSLGLPKDRPLPGTESPNVPYFLVGDEAFGLHRNLMRPFGGKQLTVKKRLYNYRHCRARRYVECTFGILSNKWMILHRPLNVNVNFAVDIVKACVVLHNYVRDRDGYNVEDTSTIQGLQDESPNNLIPQGGRGANLVRNVLADYFTTPAGSVPWQWSKV